MKWNSIDNVPNKKGIYWTFGKFHREMILALHWNGIYFSSGKFKPDEITHWCEMELKIPQAPEINLFE